MIYIDNCYHTNYLESASTEHTERVWIGNTIEILQSRYNDTNIDKKTSPGERGFACGITKFHPSLFKTSTKLKKNINEIILNTNLAVKFAILTENRRIIFLH